MAFKGWHTLVPIALFSSLNRRGLGTRNEGFWRHRISSVHVCSRDVSIYCLWLSRRSSKQDSRNPCVVLHVQQKEAIRNTVFLRKDTLIILPTGFGKPLIFQLLLFVFDSWLGAKKSFILVVSLLNALMRDQTVKLNDVQVSCLLVRNT